MGEMNARALAVLVSALALAGCPGGSGAPLPVPPVPSPASSQGVANASSSSGTGTIDAVVQDERGRPFEGAVLWCTGVKPSSPCPGEPVILEQKDLEFRPSLLVARRGQRLLVRNSDQELHNVHSQDSCCEWNVSVASGKTDSRVLDVAGEALLLCNVHSHMRAELLVLDAEFARSDAAGKARLEGVPAGARKLAVRAFDRSPIEVDLTVEKGATASVTARLPAVATKGGVRIVPPEELPWPTLAARVRGALEDSVRWASQGDAASAREAAELALGRWYSGSGLKKAVLDFDRESGIREHFGRSQDLGSSIGRLARQAELAASAPPEEREPVLEKLRSQVEKTSTSVEDVARKLPKREPERERK
ncbi:hypothetical protein HY251_15025 [bacterium]|nr:hypothetical protein [bacterium]